MVAGLSEKLASACGRIWCSTSCQIHDSSNIVDPASSGVRIAVLALISCFFNSWNCCNIAVSAPRWMRQDQHWLYTWEWKDIHILSPFTVPLALVTTCFLGAPRIRSEYWNNFSAMRSCRWVRWCQGTPSKPCFYHKVRQFCLCSRSCLHSDSLHSSTQMSPL